MKKKERKEFKEKAFTGHRMCKEKKKRGSYYLKGKLGIFPYILHTINGRVKSYTSK